MSRQSRLVAGFISQLASLMIFANSAFALTAGETNSIVSCVENGRAGQVTLTTRRRAPIPAPQVSFLPGVDGEIIMTADFDGLMYNLPTKIIRVSADTSFREKGIREIRIGLLQESPPVSRISVVAGNTKALKGISFKTATGNLVVHWPVDPNAQFAQTAQGIPSQSRSNQFAGESYPSNDAAPPVAPDFRKKRPRYSAPSTAVDEPTTTWSSSELLSTTPAASSTVRKKKDLRQNGSSYSSSQSSYNSASAGQGTIRDGSKGAQEEIEAPPDLRPLAGSTATNASNNWTEDKPPVISLSMEKDPTTSDRSAAAFRLKIKSDHSLSYSTFRLSNPERYVIDFTNCPELVNSLLPDPQESEFIRSIRVGQPDDASKTRLVIDLINEPVAIKEQVQREASQLTIRLSRSTDVATTAPNMGGYGAGGYGGNGYSSNSYGNSGYGYGSNGSNGYGSAAGAGAGAGNGSGAYGTNSSSIDTQPAMPMKAPAGTTIVLDAGHGGSDPGAQRGDVQEKEITMDIINKLRRKLEARGFKVTLTRADDTFVSLEDRVRITNNLQPTLFLSVHINAMESANDIHGIETYYQTEQSRALADAIHENLVTRLIAPDRAVRKARFYVINHTPVPAVLAEVGFISNKDERDKLISSDYQGKVAAALEQGVMLYLDKQVARMPSDQGKMVSGARNAGSAQTGTTRLGERSNNPRLAQRKYQYEDSAR